MKLSPRNKRVSNNAKIRFDATFDLGQSVGASVSRAGLGFLLLLSLLVLTLGTTIVRSLVSEPVPLTISSITKQVPLERNPCLPRFKHVFLLSAQGFLHLFREIGLLLGFYSYQRSKADQVEFYYV